MTMGNWVLVVGLVIVGWFAIKLIARRVRVKRAGGHFFKGDGYAWIGGLMILCLILGVVGGGMWVIDYLIKVKS